MCSCGCNTCDIKAVLLKENKHRQILSENLRYHIDNNLPLTENTFRYGSDAFLNLWKEARYLYSREIIDVSEADEMILTETHLGEYGMYEGEKVPLDLPMESEETLEEVKLTADTVKKVLHKVKDDPKLLQWLDFDSFRDLMKFVKGATIDDWYQILDDVTKFEKQSGLEEAEYQGKKVALGKPKRGGSKKFYVYVMNPKTKKVKKVSFGDTSGLSAKINNPKARKAFADRHDCKNKKDKTKAGYWSCRLPRYASLLGLKGSYSGYW